MQSENADSGGFPSGYVGKVIAENVFYCRGCEVAFTSQETEKECSVCGEPTEDIGWFEHDGEDKI